MKKLHKVGVLSLANILALLGALTGAIKVAVFPVLALVAGGGLGDLDAAINTIGESVTANIKDVISFVSYVYVLLKLIVICFDKGKPLLQ